MGFRIEATKVEKIDGLRSKEMPKYGKGGPDFPDCGLQQ